MAMPELAEQPERTPKERMLYAIQSLPHDASFDDGIEALSLVRLIQERLDEIDAGHTISHEEAKRRMARWLG